MYIEKEISCQRAEFLLLFNGLYGVWHSPENAVCFMLPSAAFIHRTHAVMVPTLREPFSITIITVQFDGVEQQGSGFGLA